MNPARAPVLTRASSAGVGPPARKRASSSSTAFSTRARSVAGRRAGGDGKESADLALLDRGVHVGRDLIVVDESLVEPGRLAVAQHRGCDLEVAGIGRAPRRNVPHLVDPSLRHAILHRAALTPRAFGDPGLLPRDRRSRRNVAEVMLDFLLRRLDVDVAGDDEHRVRRRRSRTETIP